MVRISVYFYLLVHCAFQYQQYKRNIMKSESLLSQLSSLSHLSNVSYRGEKRQYIGSQFFRQSLPPGHCPKQSLNSEFKQEQIQLSSLSMGAFRNFTPVKETFSAFTAFTPYWTSELHHSIQGTSDNQNEPEVVVPKKQNKFKIEEQANESSQVVNQGALHLKTEESQSEEEEKTIKNETKNIPKNYGKAIIIFVQKNREIIEKVLEQNGNNYDSLLTKLRNLKKKINTISDLRSLWQDQQESKSLRIISNAFLRKHSLHYIYNSRIKTRLCHAKYKKRLQEAILNPKDFNHIKDY